MLRPGKIWGQSYTKVRKVSNALNFFVIYWDRYNGGSTQFAIAADKHGLGALTRCTASYDSGRIETTEQH